MQIKDQPENTNVVNIRLHLWLTSVRADSAFCLLVDMPLADCDSETICRSFRWSCS